MYKLVIRCSDGQIHKEYFNLDDTLTKGKSVEYFNKISRYHVDVYDVSYKEAKRVLNSNIRVLTTLEAIMFVTDHRFYRTVRRIVETTEKCPIGSLIISKDNTLSILLDLCHYVTVSKWNDRYYTFIQDDKIDRRIIALLKDSSISWDYAVNGNLFLRAMISFEVDEETHSYPVLKVYEVRSVSRWQSNAVEI